MAGATIMIRVSFICLAVSLSFFNSPVATSLSVVQKSIATDTLIKLKNGGSEVTVYLKTPSKTSIGNMVVLPGWNYSVLDWCTKTTLCEKALAQGYTLIMPEMSKSIYAYELFPETRKDWQGYATRKWFIDTLIPYFQNKYKILLPGQDNYLLGLSTGARGVALLCLDRPGIFKKGAGLSGDYDQTQMPTDNLMKGYYGPITDFRLRWTGIDNVVFRFRELHVPIYLGHGKADQVVPYNQTRQFADSLKKYKPNLVICHIDDQAGHTYNYWDSEVDAVLGFFKAQ